MQNLRNKKEQTNQKQTQIQWTILCQTEGREIWGLRGWGEKLKKYKLVTDGWSWGWGAWHRECSQH